MLKHNFSEKSRYNILFPEVVYEGGEKEINYIKRFQNSKVFKISVGNSYSEDQLMYTFLNNLNHGGIYSVQIASHKE